MATESEKNLRLEIGHVLFIDLVGYSKLLIEDQKEIEIVLATTQVRDASAEQLIRLPTADGMALVFRNSAEEQVRSVGQHVRSQTVRRRHARPFHRSLAKSIDLAEVSAHALAHDRVGNANHVGVANAIVIHYGRDLGA
jgi:hypothetical protein